VTANECASSRRSRCSTCCANASTRCPEVTRAFVAVKLPPEVLAAVSVATEAVEITGGRKMTAAQWHLTLQFLGNDADVGAVVSAFEGFAVPGGRVRLGGAGAFPNARRGRVLWVGTVEGTDVLGRLATGVAERLAPLGNEAEARAFVPHITLVRSANPTDFRAPIAAIGSAPIGDAWDVDAVTLYESWLHPDGARYIERASVRLPR
jgi:2'-5' RNA ligase